MLQAINLGIRRGTKLLFENTSFQIHPGQKVGLTGANGTGKSSLFSLILNQLHADTGDCVYPEHWVIAHVSASRDRSGEIISYHSTRRVPDRTIVDEKIIPLYDQLLLEENKHSNRKSGMQAGMELLGGFLQEQDMEYDRFIATL